MVNVDDYTLAEGDCLQASHSDAGVGGENVLTAPHANGGGDSV